MARHHRVRSGRCSCCAPFTSVTSLGGKGQGSQADQPEMINEFLQR